MRPAKTQISLGIRPVWSVFVVRMKKACVLSYLLSAQRRLIRLGGCPDWSESSLGAHSLCWFCHEADHILLWCFPIYYLMNCFKNTFNSKKKLFHVSHFVLVTHPCIIQSWPDHEVCAYVTVPETTGRSPYVIIWLSWFLLITQLLISNEPVCESKLN